MKILLVIPRYSLTNRVNYQYIFPLGLGYISSSMKKAGFEVDCLNLNHLEGKTSDLIQNILDKKNYNVVTTGHIGIGYAVIEKIIDSVRTHSSKPKIVVGGALITSEPELMLDSLKPDFVVIGEGEITIVELLRALEQNKDLKNVDGIGFIDDGGNKIFTKPRELIKDLDSLPIPDFEEFGFKEQLDKGSVDYMYEIMDYPRTYPILGSRGCPFQCTFCYHSLGKKYRERSIENMLDEIKHAIKNYKINSIFIYDDLFSSNKERLAFFCREIKKIIEQTPGEFKWSCSLWVSTVNRETLMMLKDAGCFLVGLGFESYSPVVLKSMKKYITPEQIDNAIKLCMELQIPIAGNFIFGDVAETKETAKTTLDYWKKNCKGQVQLGFIQPYPGSEVYDYSVRKGIIKDRLDFIKNKISHTNWLNMTETMTDIEVMQLKKDILQARREYGQYIVPKKIKKESSDRYSINIKCPFCNKDIEYRNVFVPNRYHFSVWTVCRNCKMRFYIANRLYKFGVEHYESLDFLRQKYLNLHDNLLKKKL